MSEANRKRRIRMSFRVTQEEKDMIEHKMAQFGTQNREAYLRKMAIDGYVINLDLPELQEIVSLLRRSGNNINQIARRVNETGRVYDTDMEFILQKQEAIWDSLHQILTQLGNIP